MHRVLFTLISAVTLNAGSFAISQPRVDGDSFGSAQTLSPLETRNHRSISLPFLRIDPRGDVLPLGLSTGTFSLTVANDIRHMTSGPRIVSEDYELDRLLYRWRKGLGRKIDLTIDVPLLNRGGGILDPLIDTWHQSVLQIHNNIRQGVPYGRSEVIVPGSGRFGSAAGVGDISAMITRQVSAQVQVSLATKVPTGSASKLLGSGGWDAAISAQGWIPVHHRARLYAQLGLVAQGAATLLHGKRDWVHQEALSYVTTLSRRDEGILQWQGEASALRSFVAGSDSTHRTLSLGLRHRIGDCEEFTAFFTEDGDWLNYRVPELVNIAPDITIGIQWTRRW